MCQKQHSMMLICVIGHNQSRKINHGSNKISENTGKNALRPSLPGPVLLFDGKIMFRGMV